MTTSAGAASAARGEAMTTSANDDEETIMRHAMLYILSMHRIFDEGEPPENVGAYGCGFVESMPNEWCRTRGCLVLEGGGYGFSELHTPMGAWRFGRGPHSSYKKLVEPTRGRVEMRHVVLADYESAFGGHDDQWLIFSIDGVAMPHPELPKDFLPTKSRDPFLYLPWKKYDYDAEEERFYRYIEKWMRSGLLRGPFPETNVAVMNVLEGRESCDAVMDRLLRRVCKPFDMTGSVEQLFNIMFKARTGIFFDRHVKKVEEARAAWPAALGDWSPLAAI